MTSSALVPTYDRSKVLVGQAAGFIQPYDPGTPPALPLDTVALGTAWTSPWTAIGATQEGLTFAFSRDATDIVIEEQPTPVDVVTNTMEWNVNTTLAEDSLQVMKWAYGGGTITVQAATALLPGVSTLVISSEMQSFAFGFEGRNHLGFWRRVLIPVVKSVGQAETTFRRAEAPRMYAVSFRSLVAPNEVIIKEMTAPITP